MSQENVEIVRRAFDAFEEGNVSGMLALMADDLITHRPDPDRATCHGKDGFLQATADWIEGFQDWTAIPEQFIDAEDQVLVCVRQTARGEVSGVPVESEFWFVFTLRGGEIARLSFHSSKPEALEAAGLQR
jgi:ketosteroid isomerase-like protein